MEVCMAKAKQAQKQVEKEQDKVVQVKTIKMMRDDGKVAHVHQDMVEDYRKGGYTEHKG